MNEQWLPVIGFEDSYSISSRGRVRSERRVISLCNGRTRLAAVRLLSITPPTRHEKYPTVHLWRNNKSYRLRVHDLAAAAFLGPRPNGLETLHWDDTPTNNVITNLRYGTHAENCSDAIRNRPTCQAGHKWTPENTYIRKDTKTRQCRSCQRMRFGREPLTTSNLGK